MPGYHVKTRSESSGEGAYSGEKMRGATFHFIGGKSVSAVAGVLSTILIVRGLSKEAYAAYAVMLGFTILIGSLSSAGTQQAAQRYMPEFRVKNEVNQLSHITTWLLIIRISGLVAVLSVMALLIPWLATFFLVTNWMGELNLWLIATFTIVLFGCLTIQLEALLLQRVVKWLTLVLAGVRLGLLTIALLNGCFSLWNVIVIDIISQGLVCIVSTFVLYREIHKLPMDKTSGHPGGNLVKRIVRYCLFNYMREILFTFSGAASNRLIVGKLLAPLQIATYGFAQSLGDTVNRYQPSVMLRNMLMPALIARYATSGDHYQLSLFSNIIYKIGMLLLFPVIIVIALVGNEICSLLSGGKYPDSGWMLLLILLLITVEGHNQILEVHAQSAEENSGMLFAALINSSFLLLALFFVRRWGVLGLLIARFFGQVARDSFLALYLVKREIPYSFEWKGSLRMALCCILPIALIMGTVPKQIGMVGIGIISCVCLMLFFVGVRILKPFSKQERDIVNRALGGFPFLRFAFL